jgi:hypothetical protein
MSIKGWSTQEKEDRLNPQYATVEPVRTLQNALSTIAHQFVFEVGTDTVEADSTTILVNATGHSAKVGDVIRFTSGTLSGQEVKVYSVATNSLTLAEKLPSAPALGVSFSILRHKYPVVDSSGTISVSGSFTEGAVAADGGALPALTKVISGYDGSAVQVLKTDKFGQLQVDVNNTDIDVFQAAIGGTRYNQIEVKFDSSPGATYVTDTTSGGASITYSNGHAIYTSGTATSAEAKSVSVASVNYRPGAETYAVFTASFTAPTSANSFQRIGIYDTNNGFFLGYEGTSFGITKRTSATDTTVAKASFNIDTLTGAANSRFTRDGVPEAINLTYSNLFRIRYAWLGSGPVLFEVMSPDGDWVLFHVLRQPNSQLNPTIATPNLPMTIDVKKTSADATSLIMTTACWGAGTTSQLVKITDSLTDLSLASLNRAVITGVTTGGGGGYVNVKVNPSGALVADVSGTVAATQSGTWNITNVSGTVSLPTGAATSANQTTLGSQTTKLNDGTNTAAVKASSIAAGPTDPALVVAISPNNSVAVSQSGTWNINNVSGTVSLPVGAATSAKQDTGNTSLSNIDGQLGSLGQKAMTGSAPVVIASDQSTLNVTPVGRSVRNRARIDYTSTSVTTSAYVQLLASTSGAVNEVEIFDSSGQTLVLATGGAGSESDQVYIFPGGNGRISLAIATSTRVAIKAVSATANSGEISVNFYS